MGKYLSEVFLEAAGMECTEEDVEKGLKQCDELLERRLADIPTETGKLLYFFDTDETGNMGRTHFQEVLDLWDTIKEFADNERFRDYEITKLCRIFYEIRRRKG